MPARSFSDQITFENRVAIELVSEKDTLRKLDYSAYFDLLEMPISDEHAAILNARHLIDNCFTVV